MLTLIKLELRRNFMLWLAADVVFGLSFPASSLFSAHIDQAGYGSAALSATAAFWAFAGVLLAQVCFGLVAGARVRAEENTAAEDLLPVAPWQRAFAGLLAVLGYGLLFAALVWFVYGRFSSPQVEGVSAGWFAAMPAFASYLLVLSYACAYGLGGIALGLLGMLPPVALSVAGIAVGTMTSFWWHADVFGLTFSLACFVVVAAAGLPAMLVLRAKTAALSPRGAMRRNVLAAGFLLAGPLLLLLMSVFRFYVGANVFGPLISHARFDTVMPRDVRSDRGILLASARGALLAVDPSGKRHLLLEPASRSIANLLRFNSDEVTDFLWTGDGTLFVLQNSYQDKARTFGRVWKFDAQWRRELVREFADAFPADSFFRRGEELWLVNSYRELMAKLPQQGAKLVWTGFDSAVREEILYKAGEIALPEGSHALSVFIGGKRRSVSLPLPVSFPANRKYAERVPGSNPPLFRLRLVTKGHPRLYNVIVGYNGKADVRMAADHLFSNTAVMPVSDGEMVNWATDSMEFLNYDGTLSPSLMHLPDEVLSVAKKISTVRHTGFGLPGMPGPKTNYSTRYTAGHMLLLRSQAGVVEVLLNRNYFVRFNSNDGKLLACVRLNIVRPRANSYMFAALPVNDGFFVYWSPRLYFVTWDGAARRVDDWSGWFVLDYLGFGREDLWVR